MRRPCHSGAALSRSYWSTGLSSCRLTTRSLPAPCHQKRPRHGAVAAGASLPRSHRLVRRRGDLCAHAAATFPPPTARVQPMTNATATACAAAGLGSWSIFRDLMQLRCDPCSSGGRSRTAVVAALHALLSAMAEVWSPHARAAAASRSWSRLDLARATRRHLLINAIGIRTRPFSLTPPGWL